MWGAIYDELYFANEFQVSDGVDDPTMDWAAYTDSFTNEMHERPTIQEWVEETVNEVLAKQPKRVVEMGCGKGMILFKVASAPCVEEYVGCDLSRLAVKHVERVFKGKDGTEEEKKQMALDVINDVLFLKLKTVFASVLDAAAFARHWVCSAGRSTSPRPVVLPLLHVMVGRLSCLS